jgi:hypothetical protein
VGVHSLENCNQLPFDMSTSTEAQSFRVIGQGRWGDGEVEKEGVEGGVKKKEVSGA